MRYTVRELIDELENFPDDAEVRLAFQPNHPLQYQIGGIKSLNELKEDDENEAAESVNGQNGGKTEAPDVVYLLEGSNEGYGSRKLWDDSEW